MLFPANIDINPLYKVYDVMAGVFILNLKRIMWNPSDAKAKLAFFTVETELALLNMPTIKRDGWDGGAYSYIYSS